MSPRAARLAGSPAVPVGDADRPLVDHEAARRCIASDSRYRDDARELASRRAVGGRAVDCVKQLGETLVGRRLGRKPARGAEQKQRRQLQRAWPPAEEPDGLNDCH